MVEEDDCCDLAAAYWYFLRKSESTKKRKQRQLHTKDDFGFSEVISRRDELGDSYRLIIVSLAVIARSILE